MHSAREIPENPQEDNAIVENAKLAAGVAASHATDDIGLEQVQVDFLHCVDRSTFCMQCRAVDEDGEALAIELWVNPHEGRILQTYFM